MNNILRALWIALIALGALCFLLPSVADAEGEEVTILQFEGTVNPVAAIYIERGIGLAEARGSTACVIEMDTPGGLDSSMRDIVQRILEAEVPVVVYVPPGGRAASAGTFITLSAHVAAMAPGTEIGAAHPVSSGGEDIGGTMEEKVVNDAVAYIRSIAEARGRNASWAEEAVRQSRSSPSSEALELGVIDLVAGNTEELLARIDGMQIALAGNVSTTISTAGAAVGYVGMNAMERFLHTIADPNIAYILLSIGMLGIIVELFNPGVVVPGVVGGVSLLLSFFALGVLPFNYVGIIFILVGFGLFIAEIFITSYGLLTVGGIVSFVFGSTMLMTDPAFRVHPGLIAGITICIAAFFVFVIASVVRTHRRKQQTGVEAMIGAMATVRTPLDPSGTVFVRGELWQATIDEGNAEEGEIVVITAVDGLRLTVTKRKEGGE